MQKCVSCSGTLRSDETTCFICGTAVAPKNQTVSFHDRFRTVVKFLFLFSTVLTIASLFFGEYTPSFVKCSVATLVLKLVYSSANQMSSSQ